MPEEHDARQLRRIRLENVTHRFGERPVLKNISLTLSEKRIAVIGANGSGKSTFARLLNGLQIPAEGRVLVDGLDTRSNAKTVRRKVGFVFQNPDNQIVFPIVEEDVAFGLKNLGLQPEEVASRVTAILDRYDLGALQRDHSHHLSGGQKQLLALAGVLIMEPDYLVLDEPTTLLDLRHRKAVAAAISALNQTVILVTHDFDLIADFDRVIALEAGELVIDDRPAAALHRYLELMG